MDNFPLLNSDCKKIFNYCLNEETARNKLLESAHRKDNVIKEEKSNCVNFIFSSGAFLMILSLIRTFEEDDSVLNIADEQAEITEFDERAELSGKTVDSKIVYQVNKDAKEKVVLHVYNTTQKITISGKRYKWFVESFLDQFINENLEKNKEEVKKINIHIINDLKINSRTKESSEMLKENHSDDTRVELFESETHVPNNCKQCDSVINDDRSVKCYKCGNSYHKKCSSLKSDRSQKWRNVIWYCNNCTGDIDETLSLLENLSLEGGHSEINSSTCKEIATLDTPSLRASQRAICNQSTTTTTATENPTGYDERCSITKRIGNQKVKRIS